MPSPCCIQGQEEEPTLEHDKKKNECLRGKAGAFAISSLVYVDSFFEVFVIPLHIILGITQWKMTTSAFSIIYF